VFEIFDTAFPDSVTLILTIFFFVRKRQLMASFKRKTAKHGAHHIRNTMFDRSDIEMI